MNPETTEEHLPLGPPKVAVDSSIRELAPNVLKLIEQLLTKKRTSTEKSLLASVKHIQHFSGIRSNQTGLCKPELGVIGFLEKIIEETKGVIRMMACCAVRNLSSHPENATILCCADNSLVEVLVDTLDESAGFKIEDAESSMADLSGVGGSGDGDGEDEAEDERIDGEANLAVGARFTGGEDSRVLLCEIFYNLSLSKATVLYLRSDYLNLVRVLIEIVLQDDGETRMSAIKVLFNLSKNPDDNLFDLLNNTHLDKPHLRLFELLVDIVRYSRGKPRKMALMILMNLIGHGHEGLKRLASAPLLYLPAALIETILRGTQEDKILAMKCVYSLLTLHENAVAFGEPQLNVVNTLMHVIQSDKGKARALACASVVRLCIRENRWGPLISLISLISLTSLFIPFYPLYSIYP